MSVKMRQLVEREIVTACVDSFLKAGLTVSLDNGGDSFEFTNSTDRDAILAGLFQTDEERLYVAHPTRETHPKHPYLGWAFFVYGNDGWDVLSDYTVNLEPFIGEGTEPQKLADKYGE